jgi:peroxin-11C
MSVLLDSYIGRDKILRLWQYAAIFCDGLVVWSSSNHANRSKLLVLISKDVDTNSSSDARGGGGVSASISSARLVFRLFNIVSALKNASTLYSQILMNLKNDPLTALVDLIDMCVSLSFSPLEQMSWSGQVNLTRIDHSAISLWCTKLWIVSIIVNIIRELKSISKENKSNANYHSKMFLHILTLIQNSADFVNAIQFLPRGFLWSDRLNSIVVGLMGIISSAIGLYKIL